MFFPAVFVSTGLKCFFFFGVFFPSHPLRSLLNAHNRFASRGSPRGKHLKPESTVIADGKYVNVYFKDTQHKGAMLGKRQNLEITQSASPLFEQRVH